MSVDELPKHVGMTYRWSVWRKDMYKYRNEIAELFARLYLRVSTDSGNALEVMASSKRESSSGGWSFPTWMGVTASQGRASVSHV